MFSSTTPELIACDTCSRPILLSDKSKRSLAGELLPTWRPHQSAGAAQELLEQLSLQRIATEPDTC